MNFQIITQAIIKSFGWSADKRIEENSKNMFPYYLYSIANKNFKDKYEHGKMISTKYLDKKTQDWVFSSH